MESDHVRNITMDIILSLLTCMLYNIYIQYKQCQAVNAMLGREKYNFLFWFLLTLVTCGIYHIYHEFRKSSDIAQALGKPSDQSGLIALVLTIIGLPMICDAIQQSDINTFFGNKDL